MIYHYYGDLVRRLFLAAAIIMTVSLPFLAPSIPSPFELSVMAIALLVLAAGLTSPRHLRIASVNVVISVIGSIVFEYYAVLAYQVRDMLFFATNQVLAVIFLLAVYFSVKTWRGRRHEREISDKGANISDTE